MVRTNYIQWNDDDLHFVLDQQAQLDLYSDSSLKQQFMGRQVVSLRHIIILLGHAVFPLTP